METKIKLEKSAKKGKSRILNQRSNGNTRGKKEHVDIKPATEWRVKQARENTWKLKCCNKKISVMKENEETH